MQMLRLICAANTLADSIIIICIRIKSCFICMHIFSLTLRRRLFHSAYHDDDTSARNNGVSFSPPHNRWIRSSRCIAAQWDEVSFLHCHVTGGKFFENDRFILKSGKSPSVYKKKPYKRTLIILMLWPFNADVICTGYLLENPTPNFWGMSFHSEGPTTRKVRCWDKFGVCDRRTCRAYKKVKSRGNILET